MELLRGQRLKLTDLGLQDGRLVLSIATSHSPLNIHYYALGLNSNGQLFDKSYLIFNSHPRTPCGGVILDLADINTEFRLDLTKLPATLARLIMVMAIHGAGAMRQINQASTHILINNQKAAYINFANWDFSNERAIMFLEFYRKNGEWRIYAHGQGFNGGLDALLKHFGIATQILFRISLDKPTSRSPPSHLATTLKPEPMTAATHTNEMISSTTTVTTTPQVIEGEVIEAISKALVEVVTEHTPPTYKIALFGHTGSGKTWLLAALKMKRHHNSIFQATWLPTPGQTGQEWLDKAIRAIEENQPPEPNQVVANLLTLDFQFTYRRQVYRVQMIDYSGELLSPKLAATEHAQKLFQELMGMDAILVLAPTAHPWGTPSPSPSYDADAQFLARRLHEIQQSFARLAEQRTLPIALVFNMWDRCGAIAYDTPELEWQKLEKYLQLDHLTSSSPHRTLYEYLKSTLTGDTKPYQSGDLWQQYLAFCEGIPIGLNFMAFPVSAFGDQETMSRDDGSSFEYPRLIYPLRSFSVEDPFIWALCRSDEIRAEKEDQEEAAALKQLLQEVGRVENLPNYYGFLWLGLVTKLHKAAMRLRERMAKPGAHRRRSRTLQVHRHARRSKVETLYRRLTDDKKRLTTMASVVGIITPLLLGLGGEFVLDNQNFAHSDYILSNPEPIDRERQWAEAWKENYIRSPIWRHIVYSLLRSRNQVAQELQKLRQSQQRIRETQGWNALQLNPTKEALLAYLANYPLGTHAASAQQRLENMQQTQAALDWEQARLSDDPAVWAAYIKNYPTAEYSKEARRLLNLASLAKDKAAWHDAKLHNSEDSYNAYLYRYPSGQFANEASQALESILQDRDWEDLKRRYDTAVHNGEILQAAQLLASQTTAQLPELGAISKTFSTVARDIIAAKVPKWLEAADWQEATRYLEQLHTISPDLWPPGPRSLVIADALQQINSAWDRQLYQMVRTVRTIETSTEYLTSAPLQTMRMEVERYLRYLQNRNAENLFQLVLVRVKWNAKVHAKSSASFKLIVSGQEVQSSKLAGPGSVMDVLVELPVDFKAKYSDKISVTVQAMGEGIMSTVWYGPRLLGKTAKTRLTVKDINGRSLPLHNDNGEETGQAILELRGGVGAEPKLSEWRSS